MILLVSPESQSYLNRLRCSCNSEGRPASRSDDPLYASTLGEPLLGRHPLPSDTRSNSGWVNISASVDSTDPLLRTRDNNQG